MGSLYLKDGSWAFVTENSHFEALIREHMGDQAANYFKQEVIGRQEMWKEELKWYVENWEEHVAGNEYSDLKDVLKEFVNS